MYVHAPSYIKCQFKSSALGVSISLNFNYLFGMFYVVKNGGGDLFFSFLLGCESCDL